MSVHPCSARRLFLSGLTTLFTAASPAAAEPVKLAATYAISIAGVSLGRGELSVDLTPERYAAVGSGRAIGFLRILVSGEGMVTSRGRIIDGRPTPATFTAFLNDENERTTATMSFEQGSVTDLKAETSASETGRVPVTSEQLHDISDPVAALLVPTSGPLSSEACRRTLRIFDGRRRYDLQLAFKRTDAAKGTQGYQGQVLVCAVTLLPISGHKQDSALVKYLTGGRELELWLAPVAGTQLLAPYRLSVANFVGDLVITATRYDVSSAEEAAPWLRPSLAPGRMAPAASSPRP
jgi:hypothetical protein